MKIALIGATGHVGHYFLNEALQRGHAVTALVRDPGKLAARDGLGVVQADVSDPAQVASAVAGHEVVISAFNGGWGSADLRARHAAGSQAILDGVKRSALGAADALDQLRGEQRLDWVFLSPAMLLEPGQRSGKFRLGGDQVLFDAKGESRISLEDLAVAMLDEAEQPRHHRQRFTVAY
ncbi:NAD(P)-dependent oxidoreductase [Pseudomonas aeruginosa]|nr:NAD(P)-dependent oxidoreductase [Pseudomonas aeruginosa]